MKCVHQALEQNGAGQWCVFYKNLNITFTSLVKNNLIGSCVNARQCLQVSVCSYLLVDNSVINS